MSRFVCDECIRIYIYICCHHLHMQEPLCQDPEEHCGESEGVGKRYDGGPGGHELNFQYWRVLVYSFMPGKKTHSTG